jgi:TATA-box binding protein (TBP) (component of TFIID and TFIIIB)
MMSNSELARIKNGEHNQNENQDGKIVVKVKQNEQDMDVDLFVNNVVCSYATSCHLNLRRIATEGMHVEYKKENGMVNMKLRKPYTTATIWSSGKITSAGAKTEADAYKAARRFCRLLQKMKFNVRLTNFRIVNVLATCSMPFSLDVLRLADNHRKECQYEPELHPGATYKLKDLKTTLKLFTTGSVTLTAPCVQTAQTAIQRIYPILYEFRRVVANHDSFYSMPLVHQPLLKSSSPQTFIPPTSTTSSYFYPASSNLFYQATTSTSIPASSSQQQWLFYDINTCIDNTNGDDFLP